MQAQIQALLVAGGGGETVEKATTGSNLGPHVEVAKPAIFNGEGGRICNCV